MIVYTAKKTPVSSAEILPALRKAWLRFFGNEPSEDSLCILGAQWALETGRGGSMMNYNCAGIKASGDQDCTFYATQENLPRAIAMRYVANSTANEPCEIAKDDGGLNVRVRFLANHPMTKFRAYANLEDGCFDYVALLARRFALSWPAVLTGDPVAFARLLKKQGYHTAVEEDYARLMKSLFTEMKRVYATLPAPQTPAPPDTLPTGIQASSWSSNGDLVDRTLQLRDEEEKE